MALARGPLSFGNEHAYPASPGVWETSGNVKNWKTDGFHMSCMLDYISDCRITGIARSMIYEGKQTTPLNTLSFKLFMKCIICISKQVALV